MKNVFEKGDKFLLKEIHCYCVVMHAKVLVREEGSMRTPNPKPGQSLPQTTVDLVVKFYESDENSRMMPGKKDCISVRVAEGQIMMQTRLVLTNNIYGSYIACSKIRLDSQSSQNCAQSIVFWQVRVAPIPFVRVPFIRMSN